MKVKTQNHFQIPKLSMNTNKMVVGELSVSRSVPSEYNIGIEVNIEAIKALPTPLGGTFTARCVISTHQQFEKK